MTAGANPTAGGGSGGVGDMWRAHSAAIVPAAYAVLAVFAWWRSTGGVGTLELGCAAALAALAVAVRLGFVSARNRQDYFGGLALIAIGLFALWASKDLPGMRGFAFGPGS